MHTTPAGRRVNVKIIKKTLDYCAGYFWYHTAGKELFPRTMAPFTMY